MSVSIIIPVWGSYEKYLNDCLASIHQQSFQDFEIIIVRDKTDLPSARNEGIKQAKGEYILPMDVDDCLLPGYLEKTVGKGDIVTTAYYSHGSKYITASEVHLADMKRGNVVIACSLFKRKVWEDVGGYDENLKQGYEDWDFWLSAMLKGYKITVVNEPLYEYKQRRESMVNTITRPNGEQITNYIKNKHGLLEYHG